MRLLLILAFLIFAIASSIAAHADDDVAEANLVNFVNKHRVIVIKPFDRRLYDVPVEAPPNYPQKQLADNHEYVHKDMDAVIDRIEIPKKPTGVEHYVGK